jgi:LmbE family N-acetylglucosaminyl deacetylase
VTRRLTGVFAHPDDDAYVIGGTLLLDRDVELTVVFATSGEAGPISDPSQATRATLGAVREQEQADYLDAIGYKTTARVEFLHHPDYYLPDVPHELLVEEITSVLVESRPQVVVTFGPDGLTSHHDHIHVGRAATAAFHRARSAGPSADGAFQRLFYAVLPRSDVDRFYAEVRTQGYDYGEEGKLFDITGVPDDEIAVRVDTTSVRDRKWEAILQHRTQMIEHERIPESLRWIVLDSECFVQAYPEGRSGAVHGDLFHPLDAHRPVRR